MNEPKPMASLGSSLLARKGSAKPAMRPQLAGFAGMSSQAAAQNLEDLGWNDMGEDDYAPVHSGEVLQLTPAPHNPAAVAQTDRASPRPLVRSMHDELAARLSEAEPAEEAEKASPAAAEPRRNAPATAETVRALDLVRAERAAQPRRAAGKSGRRAAFTLRLDAERHLKLRLASTMHNCSAQQLVTEALDRFLDEIPEIQSLAAQLQRD
ncbi:hypothetical protein GRI75_09070 [Altererythrobacter soli]|uniref:Uncharacterized protein n=1 Tax=Croceibacterium soli TaxID=1739690 RepID=A0A6I4US47_9SPHN|nr:hypothetical protein [Croceibacterium soli]MXP41790.1 hypothetical protein [Croceibacterium soli]